jgi:uncharacterized membrane protein YgcG
MVRSGIGSLRLALAVMAVIFAVQAAVAEQWTAVKLRGTVVRLVDGEWERMTRGTVLENGQVVRTLERGHAQLVRGNETLDLGPDTQIVIFDKGGARPFTTVRQYFGTVAVEAEARDVQHFAVTTPYLAAVVKGTKFVVVSGDRGANVSVSRGRVEVDGTSGGPGVVIVPGQTASAMPGGAVILDRPARENAPGRALGRGPGLPLLGLSADRPASADEPGGRGKGAPGGNGNVGGNSGNGNSGSGNGGGSSGNGNSGNAGGSNSGSGNGNGNSGGNAGNSGSGNAGNGNSGSGNGSGNSGNGNPGNSGGSNSATGNSGNGNSGGNSGSPAGSNSGNGNSGNGNSGGGRGR